jgi:methanethiol S-methyltransferase
MVTKNHILLVALWVLYGVLHSVLASNRFKQQMQTLLKGNFKYYPLAYSIFAAITLIGILLYQYNMPSHLLFTPPLGMIVLTSLSTSLGVMIMLLMIWKYFFFLSGIHVFYTDEQPVVLQTHGLHRYVRHPLYSGTLLFIWSLFLLFPFVKHLLACFIITGYTLYGVQLEEKKLLEQFGKRYDEYRNRVPMLIPGLGKVRAPK